MMLSDLPSEILGQILHSKDLSTQVIALWVCGNHLLNSKLASGVTLIHIEESHGTHSALPPVIFKLRNLRYLYLSTYVDDSKKWTKAIRSLPPTLEALHLICENCYEPFLASSSKHIISDYGRGPTHFIDIGALFPRLHTLELNFDDEDCAFSSHSLPLLSALPSSLTCLKGSDLVVNDCHNHFASMLPKSLRRLEMVIRCDDSLDAPFFANWAESLPNLEYIFEIRSDNPPTDMSWLPKSFMEGTFENFHRSLHPSLSPFFPPLLTHLYLNCVDFPSYRSIGKPWASDLPKSLKNLELGLGDLETATTEAGQLIWQQIAYFPRSLERLQIMVHTSLDWDSIESKKSSELLWPPNLTELNLRQVLCRPEHFKLFPRTLKSLKVSLQTRSKTDVWDIDANDFSPVLTDLRIHVSLGIISIKNELPKSLTNLAIADHSTSVGMTGDAVKLIQSLPSLTTLSIDIDDFSADSGYLPPKLTGLTLSRWHAHWLPHLPKSLVSLRIATLDLGKAIHDGLANCFNGLPSTLKRFSVSDVVNTPAENKFVFAADNASPWPHLISAILTDKLIFASSFLRRLPRSMKKLEVKLETIEEKDAPFIPVLLAECVINTVEPMQPYVAEYWPLGLRHDIPSEIALRVHERNDLRNQSRANTYLDE